jgi:BlaI family transcriptional regulator, penicillinase repressor
MARSPSPQPTDGELAILKVLWAHGPAELKRVCAGLRNGRAAPTTVATMLQIMLKKGLVQRAQGERGSLWSAKVSRDAVSSGFLRKVIDSVFDGSAHRLVAHLLDSGKLSQHDLREIERLLALADKQKKS